MTEKKVVQADRVAAADMLIAMWRAQHGNVAYPWMRDEEGATLSGKRDEDWAVQFFARHRLTHSSEEGRLREALEKIVEGDVPRPVAKRWRADGQPSKLDRCEHEMEMYNDCGRCIEAFARTALSGSTENKEPK